MSTRIAAVLLALMATGCGGGGSDLPSALSRFEDGHEVTTFEGYSVRGVTLYRVALVGVADRGDVSIVGVDSSSEALVSGAALFLRMRDGLEPAELSARAFDTLLGQAGGSPLDAESERSSFGSDAEWALVTAPSVEAGALTFFGFRGEMAPNLVRHRVTLETGAIETTPVSELVPAAAPEVPPEAFCEPLAVCGCWMECTRFVPDGEGFRVLAGPHAGQRYTRTRDCSTLSGGETCARVCDGDGPDAECRDALTTDELACSEACPPTEARFHCEPSSTGCFRVEHPRRSAARAQ